MENLGYLYQWHTQDSFECLLMYLYVLKEDQTVQTLECTFRPYFYCELPHAFLYPNGTSKSMVESTVLRRFYSTFIERLISMMGYHSPTDCRFSARRNGEGAEEEGDEDTSKCRFCWHGDISLEYKKKLYYVQEREWYPFFKISFPSLEQRRKAFYRLNEKTLRIAQYNLMVKVHENQAPPILQFCSMYSLCTVGWIGYTVRRTIGRRVQVSPQKLYMIKDREHVLFPKICSFDIEVYSSNPKRMPQSDCVDDVIFQISMVFRNPPTLSTPSTPSQEEDTFLLTLGKITRTEKKKWKIMEYENEQELLIGFHHLFMTQNPQVLMGYNIMGFDIPYMIKRCELYGIESTVFCLGYAFPQRVCPVKEISWSSSAYAHQHFFFWEMDGRVVLDLLPMIRRDYKFASYTLKAVTTFFLGDTKDPVTPKDIFESYQWFLEGKKEESAKKLWTVGKYCIQDSILVWKLYEKLQLWIGLVEMANICSVPLMSLFTQGQQIKVYSQVYRFCHQSKILVESPPSSLGKGDSYVGATVFPPDPGLYDDVIPFDFSSLYPTTIIAYNIDYSSCVPEHRTDIPDEDCHVIEWEEHVLCEHDTTRYTAATKPNQTLCGNRRYRFMKSPNGVLPTVLQFLLGARKETKKAMKQFGEESLTYQVLDKRQLAYKVSANSMYGAMGVSKGYIPFLPGAMCTTARGRQSIQKASEFVQQQCQGKIVYGDSVTAYSPVWIRHSLHNEIRCMYIKDVIHETSKVWDEEWCTHTTENGKEYATPTSGYLEVWTDKDWTLLHRWMKHQCNKKIYRVKTNQGWVEVTEDHSLLLENGSPVQPQHIRPHERLLAHSLYSPFSLLKKENFKHSNSISNSISNPISNSITTEWTKLGFQIGYYLMWNTSIHKPLSSFVNESISSSTRTHDGKQKEWEITLSFLLNKRKKSEQRQQVVEGFLRCCSTSSVKGGFVLSVSSEEQIMKRPLIIQLMMTFLEEFGFQSELDWENQYTFLWNIFQNNNEKKRECIVFGVDIRSSSKSEDVYDFTTDNHHFQAGVGKIVVHNTDSIYCHFPHVPFEELWSHAKKVEKEFVHLFPSPMKLVFEEKIYKQFLILTKKRYMALTCDETLNLDDGHLTIRGVLLARRDNCAWIRKIYEQVVRKILAHETFEQVITFLCECFYLLFSYQVGIDEFVVTKLVGKDYSIRALPEDPVKLQKRLLDLGIHVDPHDKKETWRDMYKQRNQPAHVQLAEKIRQRGGESIEAGVRIPYVICQHEKGNKAKLFDKIEDPLYVLQRSAYVKLDSFYYARLFETPMDQLLRICFKSHTMKSHTCKYVVSNHEQFQKCMESIRQYTPLSFPFDTNPNNTLLQKKTSKKPISKKPISKEPISKKQMIPVTTKLSKQSSIYDFL